MKTIIADFLYNKIFINYNSSRKLLFNNNTNFLSHVVIYYLKKLKAQYKTMIFYYLCINKKIENLNEILSFMFIKYFMSKLTQL